jgi:hypothetical protein
MHSRDRILELFNYDPNTGVFTNRIDRAYNAKAGAKADYSAARGYRQIGIGPYKYYAHHLAWLIVHGVWADEIDHIDGNPSNNAIANLRLATRSQSSANGCYPGDLLDSRGVSLDRRGRKRPWRAYIKVHDRNIYIGSFHTKEEARAAYLEAADRYFGEYAYHNRAPTDEIKWDGTW